MTTEWDDEFEAILREHLHDFPAAARLTTDQALSALGMDSVGTMRMIMALEDVYEVSVPDEDLVPRNFATPGLVWSVVSKLRTAEAQWV